MERATNLKNDANTNEKNRFIKEIKVITIIGILVFFQIIVYFITKFFQSDIHLLGSKVDDAIPYISYFVYFYIIWYPMLFIVPLLLYKKDRVNFKRYIFTYVISIIIAGIIFVAYPTEVIRPNVACNSVSNCLVNFLYHMDTPALNCLPSVHCLIAFLFIVSTISSKQIEKKHKYILLILGIFIVFSTLYIKQHVIYDVIASFIIIVIVWCISGLDLQKIKEIKMAQNK